MRPAENKASAEAGTGRLFFVRAIAAAGCVALSLGVLRGNMLVLCPVLGLWLFAFTNSGDSILISGSNGCTRRYAVS